MFENPRRGRQARNFTNVSKILDLKSSSEQPFFRKLSLGAPEETKVVTYTISGNWLQMKRRNSRRNTQALKFMWSPDRTSSLTGMNFIQWAGESFEQFLTELKLLAQDCGYPDPNEQNEMVRYRVVIGCYSSKAIEKLIQDSSDLTLEKNCWHCL